VILLMTADKNPLMNIEQVRDLLSAYLDDEVTPEERAQVERALADSPDLQRELETLRHTLALLSNLPPVAAPRPFTLSEADARPKKVAASKQPAWRMPAWVVGWAGLAAALLCVLVVGGLFWTTRFESTAPAAQIALAPAAPAPAAVEAESPAPAEAAAQKVGSEPVIATLVALPTETAEPATSKLEITEAEGQPTPAEASLGAAAIGEAAPPPAQDEALTAAESAKSASVEAYAADAAAASSTESASLTLTVPMPAESTNMAGGEMRQAAENTPGEPPAAAEKEMAAPSPQVFEPTSLSPLATPIPQPTITSTPAPAATPMARLTFMPSPTPLSTPTAAASAAPVADSASLRWSWFIIGSITLLIMGGILAWWMAQKRRSL
jgi:hypothetical protein